MESFSDICHEKSMVLMFVQSHSRFDNLLAMSYILLSHLHVSPDCMPAHVLSVITWCGCRNVDDGVYAPTAAVWSQCLLPLWSSWSFLLGCNGKNQVRGAVLGVERVGDGCVRSCGVILIIVITKVREARWIIERRNPSDSTCSSISAGIGRFSLPM